MQRMAVIANISENGVRARNAPSMGPTAQPMLVPILILLYTRGRSSGVVRSVR